MEYCDWVQRVKNRSDITTRLTHLTRSTDDMSAFEVLNKILEEKTIIGSTTETGYIVGNDSAVCFQSIPLYSIAENIEYENYLFENNDSYKLRYEGFGLRINKQHAYGKGAREVFYGKTSELKEILPEEEWWRIVNHDLENYNYIIDWTHEREWRCKGNYTFEYNNIEVIVPSAVKYKMFINYWMEKDPELLKKINGIITLNSCIR